MSEASNFEAVVRVLLESAAIHPSEAEVKLLAVQYPALRAELDKLYEIPEVGALSPALTFEPQRTSDDWGDF